MDVVSVGPFQVASLFWQPRAGTNAMTVVCKATFELLPGQARLCQVQDFPYEEDNHWNDDPERSLYTTSDLVPFKPRADVMLVGDAYAAKGQPVRSLVVRLNVGSVDKRIEVVCDRYVSPEGRIEEGDPFARMPLRWERAAGGPDTLNPVGMGPSGGPDSGGRRVLPNLQPPGLRVAAPSDVIEPVCFGPVAPAWPSRRQLLGRHADTWSEEAWHERPLPVDLDASYFNAAPVDQRPEQIRGNERLVLENLHPSESRLTCALPGIEPRALLERGGKAEEVALRGDTLWIDTVRAVCTVTWRGRLELSSPADAGRVVVAVQEPGKPVDWAAVRGQALDASSDDGRGEPAGYVPLAPPKKPSRTVELDRVAELKRTSEVADEATAIGVIPRPDGLPLPFLPTQEASTPSAAVPRSADSTPGSPSSGAVAVMSPDDKSPAWLAAQPNTAARAGRPGAGATPAPRQGTAPRGSSSSPGPADGGDAAPASPPPVPASPWAGAGPAPPAVARRAVSAQAAAPPPAAAPPVAVAPAVLPPNPAQAASRMAVERPEPVPGMAADGAPSAVPPGTRAVPGGEIVELLWYDEAALDKIRDNEPWKDIIADLRAPEVEPDPLDFDAEPPPEELPEVRDRRDIVGVMTRARCIASVDLPRVMLNAVDASGCFEPPVVMLSGRLEFPFEPLERLKATVTAVTPVAAGDKNLKDTIDTVNEALQTPWLQSSGEVADGLTDKVRAAFKQANRMVSADHLDDHVQRILLEQRHYQKRMVFGQEWIRAHIRVAGSREQVPTYLPGKLAGDLPMFVTFHARVVAEAHVQQDQFESHDTALKVLALGRVVTFQRGPGLY